MRRDFDSLDYAPSGYSFQHRHRLIPNQRHYGVKRGQHDSFSGLEWGTPKFAGNPSTDDLDEEK